MEIDIKIEQPEIDRMAAKAVEDGFIHIPASTYVDESDDRKVQEFQSSYFGLPLDENGGGRSRTRKPLNLSDGKLYPIDDGGYVQGPEYNPDLGGVVRNIALMNEKVFSLEVLQKVIWTDIAIAIAMNILIFSEKIKIGLHQVRYNPTKGNPAFASPPGYHKDSEPIVFVHIVNISANLIGGENAICDSVIPKNKEDGSPPFLAHINLTEPFEALCVTKKHFHTVFPMSVGNGISAYRDILLVTFEQEKNND